MSATSGPTSGIEPAAGALASRQCMPLQDAVRILYDARGPHDVVVTSMGVAREWMALGPAPTDLVYVPSSMGQATSVGLGLALACPELRVVVCNGDGSMLMNLGSLVSITAAGPRNLTLLLFDNGVYEITGAQPTPGAAASRQDGRDIDFPGIARASGFRDVREYSDVSSWQRDVRNVLGADGPVFARVAVAPLPNAPGPRSPGPGLERAPRFMAALAAAKLA